MALFSKSFSDIKKDFSSGLGIKQSLFSFISQNDIKALNDFEEAIRNSSMTYKQAFDTYLSNAPIAIKRQANEIIKLTNQQRVLNAQYQSGKITQDQYNASITANKAEMQALTTQTQSLTFAQKAATVASKGLSIAMNLLGNIAIMGIITLISKGVKYLSDLANHVEITKEKVDELTSTFKSALDEANSNAKRVEELADRYDELSDGVNNLGENVSLTNEEYEEYNTLVNEIADMFPTLVQGYTDEGNAILNLKGNVEELRDAYKEAQQEAYNLLITDGKDSDGNDIIKQWKDIFKSGGGLGADKVGAGISMADAVEQLKAIQNMSAERYREIERIASSGTAQEIRAMSDVEANIAYGSYVQKALGLKWDISDKDFAEAKKQAKILVQTYNAEIESALSDVETLANAYLMTNDDYKQLDEQSKKAVSIMINSLDFDTASSFKNKEAVGQYVDNIIQSIKSNDEAQQALTNLFTMDTDNQSVGKIQSDVDKYINVIAQAISEDSDKLKIRLGFDDIDSELQKAKAKFVEGRFNAKPISDFLENLTLDELNIAMQIPDLFDEGLEGASKKIREWEKNNPITLTVAFDNEEFDKKIEEATKSVSAFTSSQKDLNSALEEQKEHGQLSASTMQSLIDAGYSEALAIDKVTGAVTLNTEKYKELNNEKKKEIQLEIARLKVALINPYKEESLAIADLERSLSSLNEKERKATQIKIANMRAQLANSKLTEEQIRQKEQQLAGLEAMLASLDAPDLGNSSGSDDDTPDSVKTFEAELAKRQHEINLGLRKEDASYYNWLLSAAHKAYDGLADYEEDLWKYEEQVYEWRKDHEQDLFDQRIENLDKEKEKALENNDFSTAKTSVNTQITETQKRIVELKTSGKQDVDDEIKQLEEDLEDLGDTRNEINSQEYEFNISVKEDSIEDLEKEFEKSGDISIYDKQIEIRTSMISDTQNEIDRLINEENYSMDSDEIQELVDRIEGYSDDIADIWGKQTDVIKDNVDEQIEALDRNIENTGDTKLYSEKIKVYKDGQQQILDTIEFYRKQGYAEDSAIIKELKKQWNDYQDSISDALQEQANAQVEAYNELLDEQKELLEQQKEAQDEYYDSEIKALEDKKEALEKVNETIEEQNELEEKRQAIAEAERNLYKNVRLVYSGGQWVQKAREEDLQAVKDAENDLSDTLRKQEIEALENQITALEDAKSEFDEAIDKQITAIEESEKAFEKAMENSYKVRQQLDYEFISAIVGDDKAKEYQTNADDALKAIAEAEKTDNADNSALIDSNNAVAETNRKVAESNLQKLSADDALKSIYNSFQKSGALLKGTTFEKFAGNIQSSVLNATLNTAPKIADDIVKGSMVNNYMVNNNHPVINTTVNIEGRNKSDEEIANIVATTAESKVTQALTAFVQGATNRYTKMMYGNT